MNKSLTTSVVVACLMFSSAAVTKVLTPTAKLADRQARFELAELVPARFGDWQVDSTIVPLQVDPQTQANLDKIYNQTLSRTYVHSDGERIMLSIAYGGDQSDSMNVHRPETCYTAQGFQVTNAGDTTLQTTFGPVPVRQLNAVAGARYEPITYWVTIGDKATTPGTKQKLAQLRYGLTGTVPDGMLVRVSNIGRDIPMSYALQQKFINEMLASLTPSARQRLIGVTGN